ncbi:major facilitator superfamily domain-containing protein 4A-like [Haliotis rubra]|uniref:major facilitator superfamily domain-containing protein 4A-like n=1 Tax=Haliotis rubra TaxID=36100 RepID=UPI001EE547A2|nr:major facilitator superfamily domain-containing protein 4A-like [Haliotis rubra]
MPNKLTVLQVSLWWFSLLLVGVITTVFGPTLPDLQDLYGASLNGISSLFLIMGLSLSFGCLVSVVLMKYLEPTMVLALSLLLEGVCTSTIAITQYLFIACLATAGSGLFIGCVFNTVVRQCNMVFPKSSSLLHLLLVAVSVGAYVTPLLAEPFLGHFCSSQQMNNSFTLNGSEPPLAFQPSVNATNRQYSALRTNEVAATGPNLSFSGGRKDTPNTHQSSYFKADVRTFYVMIGFLNIPPIIGLLILFKVNKNGTEEQANESDMAFEVLDRNENSLKFLLFLGTLLLAFVLFCGVSFAYGNFLTTYGVDSSLKLSVQRMAVMTSVYWLHHLIGRILGTVISTYISQTQLIYICLCGELIPGIMVSGVVSLGEISLWVASILIALFAGPLVAAMFSWSRRYIYFSPFVLGLCTFADSFGSAMLPFVAGQLMGHFGVNALMYFFSSQSIFQLVLFIILSGIGTLMRD